MHFHDVLDLQNIIRLHGIVHDKSKSIYSNKQSTDFPNCHETLECSAALCVDFVLRINPHGTINVESTNKTNLYLYVSKLHSQAFTKFFGHFLC